MPTLYIDTGSFNRLEASGSVVISPTFISPSTVAQSVVLVTGSMQQTQSAGVQLYGVNIAPTMIFTTASQTNTAFRIAPTFSGSAAFTSSQQNIIADFGATSVGTQFSVNDITSGSIYMVNDVSGLPILEATSDWTVNMYNYPTRVFQKTGSVINISGSLNVSGSTTIGGNTGIGVTNPSARLHNRASTTSTNTTVESVRFDITSTGSTAASFGQSVNFHGRVQTTDNLRYAYINTDFRFITSPANQFGGRMGIGIVNNGVDITNLSLDGNGGGSVYSNVATVVSSTLGVNGQIRTTTGATGTTAYRTGSSAADLTANAYFGATSAVNLGDKSIALDTTNNNGLVFIESNGSQRVARASVNHVITGNVAGSEGGDLIFSTKPGTSGIVERVRIKDSGSVIISGSLMFAYTSSIGAYNGEVVKFGSGTLVPGQLYFLSSSGTWSLANASSPTTSTGMLGLATGTSPTADGLLVRGFAYSGSYSTSTGSIVYAATSSGALTTTSPSTLSHVLRVVGYVTTIPNTIYFAPDRTWTVFA